MQYQAFCLSSAQHLGHVLPVPLTHRGVFIPLHRVASARFSACTTNPRTPITTPEGRVPQTVSLSRPVTLRDIFAPKLAAPAGHRNENVYESTNKLAVRSGTSQIEGGNRWAVDVGRDTGQLHRLDRLQEVVDLAVEDRRPGEAWACADIGADHGLLAICLHANGAKVIASDRAARPLRVAVDNCCRYLQHAKKHAKDLAARDTFPTPVKEEEQVHGREESGSRRRDVEGNAGDAADIATTVLLPDLECRLGEGLSVLEKGDVDTVCIAGMGVKTMIQILSESNRIGDNCDGDSSTGSTLSTLEIKRLVLQPMDARLEYVHDLRKWLRGNGWHITQETITSIAGRRGERAFLTLRADSSATHRSSHSCNDNVQQHAEARQVKSSTPSIYGANNVLSTWPGGYQKGADWLGEFLPARTTDGERFRGAEKDCRDLREALVFLAYLKHQRNWLGAIERAKSSKVDSASSTNIHGVLGDAVDRVVAGIEAIVMNTPASAEPVPISGERSGGGKNAIRVKETRLGDSYKWRRMKHLGASSTNRGESQQKQFSRGRE